MFSEQDVDRELKAALSVSPSPDFEARVLQRVETDRRSNWPARSGWFAAAAAAVVIVTGAFYALNRAPAVVAPQPAPQVPTPQVSTPQVVERTVPPALPPRLEAPAPKEPSKPPRVDTVRAARSAPRTAAPEVIVPLNQLEAVHRLVRAVNEGLIEVPAEPLQGPMPPPATLEVAPLVVDPIAIPPVGSVAQTSAPSVRGLK